jgi:hypothetical protein
VGPRNPFIIIIRESYHHRFFLLELRGPFYCIHFLIFQPPGISLFGRIRFASSCKSSSYSWDLRYNFLIAWLPSAVVPSSFIVLEGIVLSPIIMLRRSPYVVIPGLPVPRWIFPHFVVLRTVVLRLVLWPVISQLFSLFP